MLNSISYPKRTFSAIFGERTKAVRALSGVLLSVALMYIFIDQRIAFCYCFPNEYFAIISQLATGRALVIALDIYSFFIAIFAGVEVKAALLVSLLANYFLHHAISGHGSCADSLILDAKHSLIYLSDLLYQGMVVFLVLKRCLFVSRKLSNYSSFVTILSYIILTLLFLNYVPDIEDLLDRSPISFISGNNYVAYGLTPVIIPILIAAIGGNKAKMILIFLQCVHVLTLWRLFLEHGQNFNFLHGRSAQVLDMTCIPLEMFSYTFGAVYVSYVAVKHIYVAFKCFTQSFAEFRASS